MKIVVVEGPNVGREFELSGATVVGRDQSAGLVIDDPESSRRHASLSVEGMTVTVEDLGSTNGTFVNGTRLLVAQTLEPGDKLRIGTTVFELHGPAEPEVQATRAGTALPDLDDIQVTAPRQIPDFAKDEPTAPETPAPEPEPTPPSVGPPGGVAGPPGGPPPGPPPTPGGAPPPPSQPDPPAAPPPAPAPAPPPPPPAYAGSPAPYVGGGTVTNVDTYPIQVEADYPQAGIARWRPFFQSLLALPHFFVLAFVGFAGFFAWVGAFWAILFTGKYPEGIFNFLAGVQRWSTRVNGYSYLMTEQYPPFSLGEDPYPIRARFQYPAAGIARWRVLLHGIMAIPHFFVLWLLGFALWVAVFVAAVAIVFTREYPQGVFDFVLGVMRWQVRVSGYLMWMTEEYPPFTLE
jgi:hypothetical protein